MELSDLGMNGFGLKRRQQSKDVPLSFAQKFII
jgi:hypothetical protein